MITRSKLAKLTKRLAEGAQAPKDAAGAVIGQALYLDTEVTGFGLRVGAKAKAFVAQRKVRGRTVRVTIGRYPEVSVDSARRKAQSVLARMANGVDVMEERRKRAAQGITLRAAADLAFESMRAKGRSERTIAEYENQLQLYMRSWLDRPLAELSRSEVRARHQALATEIGSGKYTIKRKTGRGRRKPTGDGRMTANGVFATFRMIWNRALREHPELGSNPVANVDWFKRPPYRPALKPEGLPDWYKAVMAIENGVRRDFLLFTLFSGMRRQSVAEMRWDQVDFERRALRVPKPKGGEARAFDLPLSDYLIKILERRLAEQQKLVGSDWKELPWVWPAASASGHIAEPREDGIAGNIHDLRRVFITVATHQLKLHPYDVKLLVNHALGRTDVTAGYVAPDLEHLRVPMQRIADAITALCEPRKEGNVVSLAKAAR